MKSQDKSAIRRQFRGRAAEGGEAIIRNIELLPIFNEVTAIMSFSPLLGEPDISSAAVKWHEMGKQIYLPRVSGDDLEVVKAEISGSEIVNLRAVPPYGILEPHGAAIDSLDLQMVIVPAVALDRGGNRLGRGKGFYDRFLATTGAVTIGITSDDRLLDTLPTEPHDRRLDYVVTPSETLFIDL